MTEPDLFFGVNQNATICLDEIQLHPELFSVLRSVIDKNRKNGRFILIGSASGNLLGQSAESLAGRIGLVELSPFTINELYNTEGYSMFKFWLRGGYPESFLAKNDENSSLWLENFIRTYIERDIPQFGFNIPSLQLRRFLTMCAHLHGGLLNSSKLGESMGLSHPTIRRYIDLLEQTFILRTIQPFVKNIKKRLIKSPKIYIRDSGILHRLLSINSFNDLLGNPVYGASWEGFVIENIVSVMHDWDVFYYRTSHGNEIDFVLVRGKEVIAVESKASTAPDLNKGFWNAMDDVQPDSAFIIIPDNNSYPIKENVKVCGLMEFLKINGY